MKNITIKMTLQKAAGVKGMPQCYSLKAECSHAVLEQPSKITGETLAAKSLTVTNNTLL